MGFLEDTAPEADGVGFVGDEVEAAGNRAPFALEDGPGFLGGGGEVGGGGVATAALGRKVGDLVFDQRAQEAQVAAYSCCPCEILPWITCSEIGFMYLLSSIKPFFRNAANCARAVSFM